MQNPQNIARVYDYLRRITNRGNKTPWHISKSLRIPKDEVEDILGWLSDRNLKEGVDKDQEYIAALIGFKVISDMALEQFQINPHKSWLTVMKDCLSAQVRLQGISLDKTKVSVEGGQMQLFAIEDEFVDGKAEV